MKFFTFDNSFQFTWDQVVAGFWQKYPNPYSNHVLSEDVLERRVDGSQLITKRLMTKTNHLPKWGERFVPGLKQAYLIEESVLDLRNNTFVTYTRNIVQQTNLSVEEKCTYIQDTENSATTKCNRQVWSNSSKRVVSSFIASFGIQRYKKNSSKTVNGFDFVLNKLYVPESEADNKVNTESRKDKAKEYAKAKADSVKSKLSRPRMDSCQNDGS